MAHGHLGAQKIRVAHGYLGAQKTIGWRMDTEGLNKIRVGMCTHGLNKLGWRMDA